MTFLHPPAPELRPLESSSLSLATNLGRAHRCSAAHTSRALWGSAVSNTLAADSAAQNRYLISVLLLKLPWGWVSEDGGC